eukprot:gb/GFBE01030070.1/.p1 GENE.gb/GFBE01030070.1/~~gb/GFBE01030070.1/.p1  ORF type:complete len:334 (+),score=56.17 gb/GFBE01030070.1/:1-1002(+)
MRSSAGGRGGSLWDSDLVAGVAFHARKCSPSSRDGHWIDSDVAAEDGTKLAYRLYTAPDIRSEASTQKAVVVYFHANAELCTDVEGDVAHFFNCGFSAVLCPEFRGYAWSGGKPSLRTLYADSESVMKALPDILSSVGLKAEETLVVLHGRSLGTVCAVHLAAKQAFRADALIVESGVMSLLKLPMVMQLGMMMPQILQALSAEPCPLRTLEEMGQVQIPTLVIHGDQDEISPVDQAVAAHSACASAAKKLVRYSRAGHNDLRYAAQKEYYREIKGLCESLRSGSKEVFRTQEESNDGFLSMLGGALRCFPGMRRCLSGNVSGNAEDGSATNL